MQLIVITFMLVSPLLSLAENPPPDPSPTPVTYLGQAVDSSGENPYDDDVIEKIEAYRQKVKATRDKLILEGKIKPDGETPVKGEATKAAEPTVSIDRINEEEEKQLDALIESRKKERDEAYNKRKAEKEKVVKPRETPTPLEKVEMTEEQKKYLLEKEEFLKKFKKTETKPKPKP